MEIRHAEISDAENIADIESICFPEAEAASLKDIKGRIAEYPDRFWLAFDEKGRLVSFVNGLTTNLRDLTDEMYANADMHNKNGRWQMIFSVCTHPSSQKKGLASEVLKRVIADCRAEGRQGLVLTCKEALIPFYARLGFVNEGVSSSVHGGVVWYQMRLAFAEK